MSGPVDVLAYHDALIASHRALSADAYHAQELPKVEQARAAVAELIEAAQEYRKQYGWQGNPWQERAAIKLDAALANIGRAP